MTDSQKMSQILIYPQYAEKKVTQSLRFTMVVIIGKTYQTICKNKPSFLVSFDIICPFVKPSLRFRRHVLFLGYRGITGHFGRHFCGL